MSERYLDNLRVTDICSVIRTNTPAGTVFSRSDRPNNCFAIKTSGRTRYYTNDKFYDSDATSVMLLPKHSTYRWKCLEQGECLLIDFEGDPLPPTNHPIIFKVKSQKEYIRLFSLCEHDWNFKKPAYKLTCLSAIYQLQALLIKSLDCYHPSKKADIIKPSIEYLEENYFKEELSNEALAGLSGISTVYFRKLFTEIYGVSPTRYIRNLRIEKAKELLMSDCASKEEIAQLSGFGSIYYFSKIFKKETGMTPSEYQRS